MTEAEAKIQEAIKDYSKSKEKLVRIGKRLADFRACAAQASNDVSPGGLRSQRGRPAADWRQLLNGEELAGVVADYFATEEHIAKLAAYLKSVGYGGLVS